MEFNREEVSLRISNARKNRKTMPIKVSFILKKDIIIILIALLGILNGQRMKNFSCINFMINLGINGL